MVHFENLIDNLEWNLLRILDFLDFESDQQRLQCVLRNAEGQFHRRAKNSTMRWGNQIKFGDSGFFIFLFKKSIMMQFFDCKIQSFRVFENTQLFILELPNLTWFPSHQPNKRWSLYWFAKKINPRSSQKSRSGIKNVINGGHSHSQIWVL